MPLSAMHADVAAMGGPVIDLGLIRGEPAVDADRGPEGLPRGWGLLLALGMVLSLVSAVPRQDAPHEITRQPLRNGEFHLAGGALLLLESDRTPTPVEAYDGRDGSLLWKYTPDGLATLSYASAGDGVVVLWPDLCRSGVTGTTVAVDARNGQERWHATGVPVRTPAGVPGTVVLRSLWSDGCGALAAGTPIGGALRWQAFDADGRERWEVPVDAGTRVALDAAEGGASWAALVDRQGAVSVADFATGERSAAGTLRVAPDEAVAAAGDLLVVSAFDQGGAVLTAYRRGAYGAPAWRARVPTGPLAGRTDRFAVRPCGPVLCVAGQRTVVLDPASGAMLWDAGVRAELGEMPGGLLAAAGVRPVALLDPLTGVPAVNLAGWDVLGTDGRRMLLGVVSESGTLLGFRSDAPGGRVAVTSFAALDARLLACELDGSLLACQTDDDDVVLLRLKT
ncbi:MAG TPA: PQQ-binding-like beta-propeller repeat protein [Dactylosporangium sp.]|nr:PQQ-binding-like beta-propeller repeat protein [Dactylosporangium sp.]